MRNVSAVIRAISSAGVRGPQSLGVSVPVTSPLSPPRPSGVAGSQGLELLPLPIAGFPPLRDSQVGPVRILVPRRHGAAEAGSPGECVPPRGAGARAGPLASFFSGPPEGRRSCKGALRSPLV